MRISLALLFTLSFSHALAEPVDCAKLEDPDARLACYDEHFLPEQPAAVPEAPPEKAPANAESPPVSEATPEPPPAPAPLSETQPDTERVVIDERPVQLMEEPGELSSPGATPPSEAISRGGLFSDPKVDLTTKISAIRRGDKQKMVFLLANEQIWMQSSPRPLPFQEGDTVTIENATFGGYFMRTPQGTATRVRRIK